jgi:hypothetical protein
MKKKADAILPEKRGWSAVPANALPVIIIFLLFLCMSGKTATAQDVLILKSGKEIKAVIIQETTDIIQYREYGNQEGPLYTVAKDKVASVKYRDGAKNTLDTKDKKKEKPSIAAEEQVNKSTMLTVKRKNVYLDGVVQSPRSVSLLMEDQPEALRLFEKGKKLVKISNACPYGIMITSFIFTMSVNKKKTSEEKIRAGIPGLVIDGGFLAVAIITAATGKAKIKASVNLYNSAVNKPVSYKLDFGLQENGIGLALKF